MFKMRRAKRRDRLTSGSIRRRLRLQFPFVEPIYSNLHVASTWIARNRIKPVKTTVIAFLCFTTYFCWAQLAPVPSGVYRWSDYPAKAGDSRETRRILEGVSPHLEYLEIHATTQFPDAKPSPAHANDDIEECIIVKEGAAKVTIENRSTILGPGGVVLLMPRQMHSIENVGDSNLTYYVMRYRSKKKMDLERGETAGGSLMLDAESLPFKPSSRGGGRAYFDRPTAMCERFEMHVTRLDRKGPSHDPHSHIETEIILMLSGETGMTIDGQDYGAGVGDFYLMNSQSLHGVRNATDAPCSYFAFKWN